MDIDLQVRTAVYRHFALRAAAPNLDDVGHAVGIEPAEVVAVYHRLAARRMLVLMPDGQSIRMALPFSGIETQHVVAANGKSYFANCAWDAFGIPAALHAPAIVHSRCGQTLQPLCLPVGNGEPPPSDWRFQAVVPASRWWQDIVFT